MRTALPSALIFAILALVPRSLAQPLSSAFTFQGELNSSGAPVTGTYDFRFVLFDALTGGAQVGSTLCSDNVAIASGRFTVQLDFGAQFAGAQRFLEVQVRPDTGLSCASTTGFTTLSPRQSLTAAPNAVYSLSAAAAANAAQLNGQSASFFTNAANLTGLLPSASLSGPYSAQLTLGNPANSFTGNGAGLTQLNASSLATGTLADVRLSTNIPRLNTFNVFTAGNQFNGFTGVNRSTSLSGAEVFGLQNAPGLLGYTGMYIASTDNAGGQPFYGYSVNSRAAWTYLNPSGDWRLYNNGDTLAVTSAGNMGVGTNTPLAKLDVNGSIRSTGGIVFPDGSTQYRADSSSTTPLVTSGLPVGSTFTVTVGGTAATLSGSYTVNRVMVFSGGVYTPSGGYNMTSSNIALRRPRTTDATWAGWTTSSTPVVLSMQLAVPGGATATWSCNASVVRLKIVPVGGSLFEELELYPQGGVNIARSVIGSPTVSAPSTDAPGITFNLNNAALPNTVGFGATDGLVAPFDPSTGLISGTRTGASAMVRCNPFSGAGLRTNFTGGPSQSGFIITSGTTWRSAAHCYATRYTLRLADDGLPVEEYVMQLDPS